MKKSTDNSGRLERTMTDPRRRQVVRVLLDATEPMHVHEIAVRTLGIQPTTINSCCYALRDAGYLGVEVALALARNNRFLVLADRRAELQALFNATTPNRNQSWGLGQ